MSPAGPRSPGRTGRPWRRLVAQVKAEETHCWLCGGALQPDAVWPSRWCTTVDHILPLSRGGPPLARSNVAAAHLTCNASRGDGTERGSTLVDPASHTW